MTSSFFLFDTYMCHSSCLCENATYIIYTTWPLLFLLLLSIYLLNLINYTLLLINIHFFIQSYSSCHVYHFISYYYLNLYMHYHLSCPCYLWLIDLSIIISPFFTPYYLSTFFFIHCNCVLWLKLWLMSCWKYLWVLYTTYTKW